MIDAIKYLREQGIGPRTAKEMAERINRELHPDAARAREKWLDKIEAEFGKPKD